MKKSVLLLAVATALSFVFASNVNAQEENQALIPNTEDKACKSEQRIDIRLNSENLVSLRADLLEGEKRKKFLLEIISEKEGSVYSSSFYSKKPVFKKYDLSKLPEGNYTFRISKNFKNIYSKTISNSPNQNEQLADIP